MKATFHDALLVVGFGLVVFGCWSIYEPLAFIAAGLTLVAFSLVASRNVR